MTNPNAVDNLTKRGADANPHGRPPKGYSITEWFKEMLASKPEIKDAIGKSIIKSALEGDVAAQRLVWNYMDGAPIGSGEGQMNIGNINILNAQGMTDDQLKARIRELEGTPVVEGGGGNTAISK